MKTHRLFLKQMSQKLAQYRPLLALSRPQRGWIYTVRVALGMTTTQLAMRLCINQSTVARLEKAEENNSIKLKSLIRAAQALDCKLVYAIVPNSSLEDTIKKQAEKVARKQLDVVAHHMSLEDQRPLDTQLEEIYQQLLAELLEDHPKRVWKVD
jgi:predicted DNA-binding mobile mystery protein A